jgi:hypothetical protein
MFGLKQVEEPKLHPILQARDASFKKIEDAILELAALDKPDRERVSLEGIISANTPLNNIIRTQIMQRVAGLRLRVANPGIFASDIAADAAKANADNAARYPDATRYRFVPK